MTNLAAYEALNVTREIDEDGLGWHPRVARERGLHSPEIVFIRYDGWTVGAHGRAAEREAWRAWGPQYRYFATEVGGWRVTPITEYRP